MSLRYFRSIEWKNYIAATQETPIGFQHEHRNRTLRFQNFAIMKEIEDFKYHLKP